MPFRRRPPSLEVLLPSELDASSEESSCPPGLRQTGLVRWHSRNHGRAPPLRKRRLGPRPGLDPPRVAEARALVSPEEGVDPVRAEVAGAAAVRRGHDDGVGEDALNPSQAVSTAHESRHFF